MKQTGTTTVEPLTDRIRKAVDQGKISIPPLPKLVTRLMQLLNDESGASSKQVAELIRNDPAVAASVLKTANSAAFGGLNPISDLSQAIARLGFRQVSSVVTALSHGAHFSSDEPDKRVMLETLWGHAVATALVARSVAQLTGADSEESFVAGLLHDTGKLLVLKGVDYLQSMTTPVRITSTVLDELMQVLHTELGHRTLVSWHLPDAISEVALHHHDRDLDFDKPLIVRVQAADAITQRIGEHPNPKPDLDLLEQHSVELLNLSDLELASLMVDLEDQIAELKQLFR
jgi:HD-like signal output (HDOD) protein